MDRKLISLINLMLLAGCVSEPTPDFTGISFDQKHNCPTVEEIRRAEHRAMWQTRKAFDPEDLIDWSYTTAWGVFHPEENGTALAMNIECGYSIHSTRKHPWMRASLSLTTFLDGRIDRNDGGPWVDHPVVEDWLDGGGSGSTCKTGREGCWFYIVKDYRYRDVGD